MVYFARMLSYFLGCYLIISDGSLLYSQVFYLILDDGVLISYFGCRTWFGDVLNLFWMMV